MSIESNSSNSVDVEKNALMEVNDIEYEFPKNLSVVNRRVLIRSNFNKSSYAHTETATCYLNSGDWYVDGKNSYLYFSVLVIGACATGDGSLANLVNSITFTSKSGTEIERQLQAGDIRIIEDRYRCSGDWFNSAGQVMGYLGGAAYNDAPVGVVPSAEIDCCIPLGKLLGLGRTEALLPSQLVGGARIDITFNTPQLALVGTAALAAATYTITNPSIVLDSYLFNDGVLRQLNSMAASRGLDVYFDTFDHSRTTTAATSINMDARKAVSRAQYVVARTRLDSALDGTINDNPTISEVLSPTTSWATYQFNLGGLYFPNAPVSTEIEMCQNALYCYGKMGYCDKPGSVGSVAFMARNAIACATLERSSVLALSGLPVSSARVLSLNGTFDDAQSRTTDMYLNYIKVAKVFLNRCIVKE